MAKSFWKGAISFGLVSIPVRMSLATTSKTPSFHLLHKKCLTRPKQTLYCPTDEQYFDARDTVRGYEYVKGQYVVFEEDDFEKVPVSTLHTIAVQAFAVPEDIDPLYYYGSHYIEPEELGAKAFFLLCESMLRSKYVAIANVTFQRREHLCCLRPVDDIMVLHTIHYRDEILPRGKISIARPEVTDEEMRMATTLMSAMVKKFEPGEYRDGYTEALRKLVEAKANGDEIKLPTPAKIEVADLMSALKKSIEAAQKKVAV